MRTVVLRGADGGACVQCARGCFERCDSYHRVPVDVNTGATDHPKRSHPLFQRLNKTLRRSAVEALAGRGFYRVAPGSPEFTRRNNTREAINEFYSDANEIRDYLSPSRLDFYREVAEIVTRQRSATG